MRTSYPSPQTSVAKQSGGASVLVTSTVVLAANPDAVERTVVNDSANVVYLQFSTTDGTAPTAVAGQGVRLNANGGSWTSTAYTGAVAGIAVGATSGVTVAEF